MLRSASNAPPIWLLVTLIGSVIVPAMSHAQASPSRREEMTAMIGWNAPASCSTSDDLVRKVEALVGRRVFTDPEHARYFVRVQITADSGAEWTARLILSSRDGTALGERELRREAASCQSLDIALSVALGLMLDVAVDEDARTPEPVPMPSAKAAPAPTPARTVYRLPPEQARWTISGDASAAFALGMMPGLMLGADLGFNAQAPPFVPIRLGLTIWAPKREPSAGPGVQVEGWQAQAGVCPSIARSSHWAAHACVTSGLLHATGTGLGYAETRTKSLFVPQIGARVNLRARLFGHVSLLGSVGTWVNLSHRYTFFGVEEGKRTDHYQSWPMAPEALVGVDVDSGW